MTPSSLACDMDVLDQRVWQELQFHHGAAHAISQDELALRCQMTSRRVRIAVKSLIEVHQILIGSRSHPPYGYYLIVTPEELRDAKAELYSRLCSLARRLAKIERISLEQVWGQARLKMGDEHD